MIVLKGKTKNQQAFSTCFVVVKTDSPQFYKPPTHFVVVKMDSLNLYKSLTCFVVFKTDSPNLYCDKLFYRAVTFRFNLYQTVFGFFQLLELVSDCHLVNRQPHERKVLGFFCCSGSAKSLQWKQPIFTFCVVIFGLPANIQIVQNGPGETKCSKF